MDFYINLHDMSSAIASLSKVLDGVEECREKTCRAVNTLCESGWEGESREAYLAELAQWHIEMQALLDLMEDLRRKLGDNLPVVDELLDAGKALAL